MKATLIILTMLASALAASAQQPVTATAEDGRKVHYSIPMANGAYCAGLPHKSIIPVSQERRSGPHLTNSYKNYTIGSGQASIRFRRGERYPGRILMNHHAEVDVNGVSYSVPRGVLVPIKHLDLS